MREGARGEGVRNWRILIATAPGADHRQCQFGNLAMLTYANQVLNEIKIFRVRRATRPKFG